MAADSEQWQGFVRDVVQMPETMTPAIQEAIRQQRWKIAPNPLASIRTAAHQEAKRMGLTYLNTHRLKCSACATWGTVGNVMTRTT